MDDVIRLDVKPLRLGRVVVDEAVVGAFLHMREAVCGLLMRTRGVDDADICVIVGVEVVDDVYNAGADQSAAAGDKQGFAVELFDVLDVGDDPLHVLPVCFVINHITLTMLFFRCGEAPRRGRDLRWW